jgi:hypothetical protein
MTSKSFWIRRSAGLGVVLLLALGAVPSGVTQPAGQPLLLARAEGWTSRFIHRFRRNPPLPTRKGGTRGNVCLLSPDANYQTGAALWSNEVMLVWKGQIGKVAVQKVGSAEPLWSREVVSQSPDKLNALRYGGPALEPGGSYQWQIFGNATDSEPRQFMRFRLMDEAERAAMTRAWQQRSGVLRQTERSSPEAFMQGRLVFLLERGLAADFYQTLLREFLRGRLDAEGMAIVQGIVAERCGS